MRKPQKKFWPNAAAGKEPRKKKQKKNFQYKTSIGFYQHKSTKIGNKNKNIDGSKKNRYGKKLF